MGTLKEEDQEEDNASVPLQINSQRISIAEKRRAAVASQEAVTQNQRHGLVQEMEREEEGVVVTTKSTEKFGWRRYCGLVFALLCSLFFSMTVLLAKVLHQSYGHHPFVITMWRYGGILVPSIPVAYYFQRYTEVEVFETLSPISRRQSMRNLFAYLMQGILGCTSTIFRFISIQFIPIADSTVVFSTSTVLVTILAHICIGEKCGVVSVIFAFITAIGVIIIARPPIITGESEFDLVFLKGIGFAVLALFCTSTFLILMRKIRRTHFALMMLVGGTWGVFESGMLALLLGVFTLPRGGEDLALIVGLALLTFLGQTCFVLAVKYENAGPLAIARTSESIYAFLWQYLFLSVVPDLISISGGALVIFAMVGTGYCKYLGSLPVDHPRRQKFEFLLR